MNKYPTWLNVLVLVIVMTGILLALPNIYGSAPAVQMADRNANAITSAQLDNFVQVLSGDGLAPEAAYIRDGRAVLRFAPGDEDAQQRAADRLRGRYDRGSDRGIVASSRRKRDPSCGLKCVGAR